MNKDLCSFIYAKTMKKAKSVDKSLGVLD